MARVTQLIKQLIPTTECSSLLDIGIGDGGTIKEIAPLFSVKEIYGVENLIDPTQHKLEDPNIKVDFKPYETSEYYDTEFDAITLFDSLPCYNKDKGIEILTKVEEKAKKLIIVWLPDGFYPYPPFHSCWHAEDFLSRGYCVYKAINFHQGPPMVASGLLAWKILN